MPETARYKYHDEKGVVVYEAIRIEPGRNGRDKDFDMVRAEVDGSRTRGRNCMEGVERVPYLLPLLRKGIERGKTIYFVEGEKCADALVRAGLVATTRSEGAQAKLENSFLEYFRGAKEIVVCADCDIPGRQCAAKRASIFAKVVEQVRIVDLARQRTDGYDVADFLAEGRSVDDFLALVKAAPIYDPPRLEEKSTKPQVEAARIFTLADLLHDAVRRTEDAVENGPRVQASPWGPLNFALGGNVVHAGFSPQETVIWAAVPGGGKSAATWSVADYTAAKCEGTAVLVSAEMGEIDAVQRLISLYSGITTAQLRSGSLSSEEWEKLSDVEKILVRRRMAIIGRDGRDLVALKKSLDSIASKYCISCIVVDHIGKIIQGKSDKQSRNDANEAVIEALANMAIEYDCVMHVVQHLNRQGYGQRPTLATLRDGGNTEGHANVVIFPYRKYPNAPDPVKREAGEFILEKCRDGYTGSMPMKFDGGRYLWTSTEENGAWFEHE